MNLTPGKLYRTSQSRRPIDDFAVYFMIPKDKPGQYWGEYPVDFGVFLLLVKCFNEGPRPGYYNGLCEFLYEDKLIYFPKVQVPQYLIEVSL